MLLFNSTLHEGKNMFMHDKSPRQLHFLPALCTLAILFYFSSGTRKIILRRRKRIQSQKQTKHPRSNHKTPPQHAQTNKNLGTKGLFQRSHQGNLVFLGDSPTQFQTVDSGQGQCGWSEIWAESTGPLLAFQHLGLGVMTPKINWSQIKNKSGNLFRLPLWLS